MFVFLGIGWMEKYQGLATGDQLLGGGKYPVANGTGGEIFNFSATDDGFTYGHVETIRGDIDRRIRIENFGAAPGTAYVDGVDIVWIATDPVNGGRRVVGFYRNARLYRERQETPASKLVGTTHIVRCANSDAIVLPLQERTLRLTKGKGWMGQAQWWKPDPTVRFEFLADVLRIFEKSFTSSDELIDLMVDEVPPDSWEGRETLVTHLKRERDRKIIAEKKRRTPKPWKCEVCAFDFASVYGERGSNYIEAHHDIPLSQYPKHGASTKLEQLKLVCSNCHRMIHAKANWLTLDELRAAIASRE